MKITRLSAPAFETITEDELSEWLRIDSDADKLTTTMLIESATDVVEGLTDLTLVASDFQIDYAHRARCYTIPLEPLQSITSVVVDGEPVPFEQRGSKITLETVPLGEVSVEVRAGYATTDAIPVSLRHAVAVIVSAGYDGREDIDPATQKTVDWLCSRHRRVSF